MLLAQLAEAGRIDLVGNVSHGEGDVACIIPAGILRKGFDDIALVVDDLVARAVDVEIPAGRVVQLVVAELRTLADELVLCHGNPLPKQRMLYTLYAMARVVSRERRFTAGGRSAAVKSATQPLPRTGRCAHILYFYGYN